MPPTAGALYEHILHAHLKANIWNQDVIIHPVIPDACQLGWSKEDGRLRPILSEKQVAPEAVVELIRCTCSTSGCSRNTYTCKRHNLECTELCNCKAEVGACNNIPMPDVSDSSDGESDEESELYRSK